MDLIQLTKKAKLRTIYLQLILETNSNFYKVLSFTSMIIVEYVIFEIVGTLECYILKLESRQHVRVVFGFECIANIT